MEKLCDFLFIRFFTIENGNENSCSGVFLWNINKLSWDMSPYYVVAMVSCKRKDELHCVLCPSIFSNRAAIICWMSKSPGLGTRKNWERGNCLRLFVFYEDSFDFINFDEKGNLNTKLSDPVLWHSYWWCFKHPRSICIDFNVNCNMIRYNAGEPKGSKYKRYLLCSIWNQSTKHQNIRSLLDGT